MRNDRRYDGLMGRLRGARISHLTSRAYRRGAAYAQRRPLLPTLAHPARNRGN